MSGRFLLVLFLAASSLSITAQDARLSQVWTTPMHVNPSLSGRFDGQGRFAFLNSSQTAGYFVSKTDLTRTSTARINHMNFYMDYKFGKYRHVGDEERYAVGKDSLKRRKNDEAKDETGLKRTNKGYWSAALNYYTYGGGTSPLEASFLSATLARHFYSGRNKYFGFGVQGVYASAKLDETGFTSGDKIMSVYQREISGNGFKYLVNEGSTRYDSLKLSNKKGTGSYFDFNAGAYYGMATEAVSFELGGAMYHFFYPGIEIIEDNDGPELRHRVTAHSLLRLKLNNQWGFVQRNIYWQEGMYLRSRVKNGDGTEIKVMYMGVELYKMDPKSNKNINFGFYTRSFQTAMPFININVGRVLNLRYSYEMKLNSDKFQAYTANRSEVVMMLTYKRYTPPGTRFSRKVNYW
jgi:hypothetical protein